MKPCALRPIVGLFSGLSLLVGALVLLTPAASASVGQSQVTGTLHRWVAHPHHDHHDHHDHGVEGSVSGVGSLLHGVALDETREAATVQTADGEIIVPPGLLPTSARTGDQVTVTMREGTPTSVTPTSVSPTSVKKAATGSQVAASSVNGTRTVVVALTSTQSPVTSPSLSPTQAAEVMSGVESYYANLSSGKITFTTKVLNVTVDSLNCNEFSTNMTKVRAAAGLPAFGEVHLVLYSGVSMAGCSYGGLASLGGWNVLIAPKSFTVSVLVHELGHNLGLGHSSAVSCPTGLLHPDSWYGRCDISEYGDEFTPMGRASAMGLHAHELSQLGVLSPDAVAVDTAGVVELTPVYATGSGTRALVLSDPGSRGSWWVEMRDRSGLDARNNALPQVLVRFVQSMSGSQTSYLVDLTPEDYRFDNAGMVVPGATFTSPDGQFSVQLVALSTTARLQVRTTAVGSSPLAVSSLSAVVQNRQVSYSFTQPAITSQISRFDVVLQLLGGGLIETSLDPSGAGGLSGAIELEDWETPELLTVTTVMLDGQTASTSIWVNSAASPPSVKLRSRVKGGSLTVEAPAQKGRVVYRFIAISAGHPVREIRTSKPRATFTGLPASVSRWTVELVVFRANQVVAAGSTRSRKVGSGGVEVTVRDNPQTVLRVRVPKTLRTSCSKGRCTPRKLVLVGEGSDGWVRLQSVKIPRNGVVVIDLPSEPYNRLQVRIGSTKLTPIHSPVAGPLAR